MNAFARATIGALPWRGARVAVLGLARSGLAAARDLVAVGARVRVLDGADTDAVRERARSLKGAEVILGHTDPEDLAGVDLVITSPGVPWHSPWITRAHAAEIPVWSEIELAFRLGIAPVVGITGTNGKTTTTEMTAAALTAAGRDAIPAGNVGMPLLDARGRGAVVAELSSFQLQGIVTFRTPVAVLLNLGDDHLDWHGSREAYAAAKGRIFENQRTDDVAVVFDDEPCMALAAAAGARVVPFHPDRVPPAGAGVDAGWIVVPQGRVVAVDRLPIAARPIRADAVAAAAAACALGADPAVVGAALASYRPRAHRIETIAVIGEVTYVNDSKATDPHATLAALEEMHDVVLIAGGRNKGVDMSALAAGAAALRAVVTMGEAADEIAAAFAPTEVPVEAAEDMEDAVARARRLARAGDTVLLSPACASFDRYDGYEARGDAFRDAVAGLERGSR